MNGQELRKLRLEHGFSQKLVGEGAGVPEPQVSEWERSIRILPPEKIDRLERCVKILIQRKAKKAARPPAPTPLPIEREEAQ